MAAPSHDFSQILEEMQKASETGWDSLVNVCYEIRKVVGEFSFKESMVDEIAPPLSVNLLIYLDLGLFQFPVVLGDFG